MPTRDETAMFRYLGGMWPEVIEAELKTLGMTGHRHQPQVKLTTAAPPKPHWMLCPQGYQGWQFKGEGGKDAAIYWVTRK